MYALVDCNNFYVSCERAFNPKLERRPVIVLSNNDGCAIARSNEAKHLGIEMGTPAFLIEDLIKRNNVAVLSSNYALYGDLSDRVMTILNSHAPAVEQYSIDEAFLDFTGVTHQDLVALSHAMRGIVRQHTSIPVSIGLAPTKTLAKMANRLAKKREGVHWIRSDEDRQQALQATAIKDIWGIGPERTKLLLRKGIQTGADLAILPEAWMRKEMSVTGERLLRELQGTPCVEWDLDPAPKKNICTSRSFGKLITEKQDMIEAVATYTASCAEKLRAQGSCARQVHVFIQTNPHKLEDRQYFRSITIPQEVPTNHTPELTKAALKGLELIYRNGYRYMKCGVIVMDLVPATAVQGGLFDTADRPRNNKLMDAMDKINTSFGPDLVRFAVQGFEKRFKLRQAHRTPRYTTRIDEIVKIRL